MSVISAVLFRHHIHDPLSSSSLPPPVSVVLPSRRSGGAVLQRWRSGSIKTVPELGVPAAVSAAASGDQSSVETLVLRTPLLPRCSPTPPVLPYRHRPAMLLIVVVRVMPYSLRTPYDHSVFPYVLGRCYGRPSTALRWLPGPGRPLAQLRTGLVLPRLLQNVTSFT